MKNNTQEAKLALNKALSSVPDDFALSEVKYHIRAALLKIENVEKNRNRREENFQKREEKKQHSSNVYFNPLTAIQAIDEEILKEKIKLQEIKNRQIIEKKGGNNDELQSLFD